MEYISHSDYTDMLKSFGKETPKGMLKEGMEKEGNAFTAGLANAKKGETFKVDGKTVKDKSNYDAPVEESDDALQDVLDSMAARLKGQSLDYEKLEQIADALQKQGHSVNARYLQDFLKQHDVTVKEATINDEYPESWKMRENATSHTAVDIAKRMKEQGHDKDAVEDLLGRKGISAEAIEDALSTVFGAEEGINLPSPEMQATGPTIQPTESDQTNRFSTLSPSEREQLKEYIESIKTIKQEISKLVGKAKPGAMMEAEETIPAEVKPTYQDPSKKQKAGGDRTALVMKKGEMWEDDAAEPNISPKLHTIVSKLIAALKAEGLDDEDIQMLVKHEIETAGQQDVMGQWDM